MILIPALPVVMNGCASGANSETAGYSKEKQTASEPAEAEESAAPIADVPQNNAEKQGGGETETARQAAAEPEPVYLSADDSNSAASPVIARKLIRLGKYVHPDIVRIYGR